jgi:hypothetical protein
MTALSEREFWMHRRSIKKKTVDPLVSLASVIAIALAVALMGAATYDFGGAIISAHSLAAAHTAPIVTPKHL